MARDFYIAGQSLVLVRGSSTVSTLNGTKELGLCDGSIQVSPVFRDADIKVDAWGQAPPEVQTMLAEATITMTLVHFDRAILESLMGASSASATFGQMPAAGTRMAGYWVSLYTYTPANTQTYWRFPQAKLLSNLSWPLGAEKSLVRCSFRALPVPASAILNTAGSPAAGVGSFDPWQSAVGSLGSILWDHTAAP